MALTLGITGMDSKTEAEMQAAFKAANAETGNKWTLVGDDSAEYVVIDMDSLYGPMSWLRLHAAGRTLRRQRLRRWSASSGARSTPSTTAT